MKKKLLCIFSILFVILFASIMIFRAAPFNVSVTDIDDDNIRYDNKCFSQVWFYSPVKYMYLPANKNNKKLRTEHGMTYWVNNDWPHLIWWQDELGSYQYYLEEGYSIPSIFSSDYNIEKVYLGNSLYKKNAILSLLFDYVYYSDLYELNSSDSSTVINYLLNESDDGYNLTEQALSEKQENEYDAIYIQFSDFPFYQIFWY